MAKIYKSASEWTKEKFGKRVQKIPVDGGFSCPNRDGKLSTLGCLYCNNKAFTPFYTDCEKSVTKQLETGIEFFSKRYDCDAFFAYFQTYSGTYAPIEILREKYSEVLAFEAVKGLIVSTRPDCINEDVINLLKDFQKKLYVRVEIGVEAFDDNALKAINRCHDAQTALKAINMITGAGIDCSVHLIFGLPDEPADCAKQYATILSSTKAKFVKLHHLQIVEGSRLADLYKQNNAFIKLHTLDSYVATVAEFISNMRSDIFVERFINKVPRNMLIAPVWGGINENCFCQHLEEYLIKHTNNNK